jgi:hypothetical protein
VHGADVLLGGALAVVVLDHDAAVLALLEQDVDVAGQLLGDGFGVGGTDDDVLVAVVAKVEGEGVGTCGPALQMDERVLLLDLAGLGLHADDVLLGDAQHQLLQTLLALGLPLAAVVRDTVGLERAAQLHVAVLGIDL